MSQQAGWLPMPDPIHCSSCDAKIDGYVPFMREDDDSLYCDNCWDMVQEENCDHAYDEPTEQDEWHSFDPDC